MSLFCLNRNYDFDFYGDKSNKLVSSIIGFLMYIVTISITSSFFAHNLISGWKNALNGHITIEFRSNTNGIDETLTNKQSEEVIEIIKSAEGVKFVKKLHETDILKILEPWLNSTAIPDDFPFPIIFDVETDGNVSPNLSALSERLSKISSGVKIHDHANWYAPIVKISNSLLGFAAVLSILTFIAVCATVIFIIKKTLGMHHNTVKILQLIGASNSYIADQFKRYYFTVGCKASVVSILCSAITVGIVFFLFSRDIRSVDVLKYGLIVIVISIIATLLVVVSSKNAALFFLKNDKLIH